VKATKPEVYNERKRAKEDPETYKPVGSLLKDFNSKIRKV